MSKMNGFDKRRYHSFFLYVFVAVWSIYGCATKSTLEMKDAEVASQKVIENVNVDHLPTETVIEVINSANTPYTAFKLPDPPRVVVDINGKTGADLSDSINVNEGSIKNILLTDNGSDGTRMVVNLNKDSNYRIMADGNTIKLFLPEDKSADEKSDTIAAKKEEEKQEYTESEPRIFFKPTSSALGQILGIDFTMLPQGKSRLTVTTNKKVDYDLDRTGVNKLSLNIHDSKISNDVLLKYIDTSEQQTALETVKPVFDKSKNEVSLKLTMREVVPFHIKENDDSLIMDFGKINTKIPEKAITPLNLTEAKTRKLAAAAETQPEIQMFSPSVSKKYNGQPLYLDFINADVTHILRLINEVSKENIIWDPAIKGKKVSMILNDVPWDEALELILRNNDLAKRYVGQNIVWITTKQKMAQILAEEESEARKMEQKLEQERQKLEEQRKRAEDETPLMTEYLPIDFATAAEIQEHIITSPRGKMSIDTRSNTIIITDTAKSIEAAKQIVKQFDTPVKQIMIEARIVDASENFSRDLGIKWNNTTSGWRASRNDGETILLPPNAADADGGFTPGQQVYGGSFSTNSPDGWESNIGVSFARLTSSGLGAITLDASLALAETDGTAKVMSAPKVIAREGTSATISSGDKLIIDATENVSATTLEASLSLKVTPTSVSYNDFITLEVDVTDDQAPSREKILQKAINTTLMVKSGETVVIGGIIKESESDSVDGVPVLKDIPGLRWLFQAKSKKHTKSELLIFLTPTVLPSPVKHF